MKTRYQAIKKRNWDERAFAERRAIALAALVILPLIFYYLIWQPAHHAVARLSASVPVLRAQAALLHDQAAEVATLEHSPHPAVLAVAALKSVVETSAEQHQIRGAITTLDAQGSNSVRMTLDSVSFDRWLRWMRDLQQEQNVRVDSAGVAALSQPGMVKINSVLTNGGDQ
jgi:general secretion pathway protein M